MKIELKNECNREMWFYDRKTCSIWPVFAVRESRSGDTIQTGDGKIIRTCANNHAVFNNYDYARIAQKYDRKEFDYEFELLEKKLLLKYKKPA